MEAGGWIDTVIEALQHHFFMVIGGMICWFALRWSIRRNQVHKKGEHYNFWYDQKDEIIVTFAFGMTFLVWDDETLAAVDYFLKPDQPTELNPFFYLIVAPIVERVYKLFNKD